MSLFFDRFAGALPALRRTFGDSVRYIDRANEERIVTAIVARDPRGEKTQSTATIFRADIDFTPRDGDQLINGAEVLQVVRVETNEVEWRLGCRLVRRLA